MRRVVITGMGVISPLGNTIDAFWHGLISGRSVTKSLNDVTSCNLFDRFRGEFASQVIVEVEQFEQEAQKLPAHVRERDRYVQFAVAAALQAVYSANLDISSAEVLDRFGITLATCIGSGQAIDTTYCQATRNGTEALDPEQIPADFYLDCIFSTPSILLAQLFNLHGPCDTLSTACVSGIDVVGRAYELIRDGNADIMLAGGSEAPITPSRFAGCDVLGCLTTQFNDQPQRASRPFDAKRSGYVMGEGSGMILVEEREHALVRGAPIYAEITGFSLTCNAFHMISLKPEAVSNLVRAIEQALQEADVTPAEIDYINAHGNSTNQHDEFETLAFKEVLGKYAYSVPISSTKSMMGYSLAASGVFSTIAAALSLFHGKIHPTINYEEPDPRCDLDYVPNTAREFTGNNALVVGSGFSGTHGALILQKEQRGLL